MTHLNRSVIGDKMAHLPAVLKVLIGEYLAGECSLPDWGHSTHACDHIRFYRHCGDFDAIRHRYPAMNVLCIAYVGSLPLIQGRDLTEGCAAEIKQAASGGNIHM